MTAKKVRCRPKRNCVMCQGTGYWTNPFDQTYKCDCMMKPRKPSPAKKPEKIWVVERLSRETKKYYGVEFRDALPEAKYELKFERVYAPDRKFRLREYTAGKVLKG